MDKEPATNIQPKKIEKVTHFHTEIDLPPTATVALYKPQHTQATKKSKKSKRKFQQFCYYRFAEDKTKIMKILFKNQQTYMNHGYYPFTDPLSQMHKSEQLSQMNLLKVIKVESVYIGHVNDEIIIKKMTQVKLGQDGNQFDTIDDNFEIIKIGNKQRFQQFLRILKNNPKALQISIRVIIDQSIPNEPIIIDYEFFKRESQIKTNNLKFMEEEKKQDKKENPQKVQNEDKTKKTKQSPQIEKKN